MPDHEDKRKRSGIGTLSFIGVVLTAVGIITPIVWSYYTSKISLDAALISLDVVITPDELGESFVLQHRSDSGNARPIDSLASARIVVRNTGRKPLHITPDVGTLTVHLPADAKLLTYDIARRFPDHLEVLGETNADGNLELRSPLLNPGDSFEIACFFESDAPSAAGFDVRARIPNLPKVSYKDLSREVPKVGRSFGVTGWIAATVTAVGVFFLLWARRDTVREKHVLTTLDMLEPQLRTASTPDDFRAGISKALAPLPLSARKSCEEAIEKHVEWDAEQAIRAVRDAIAEERDQAKSALGCFTVLAFLGIAFVAYKIGFLPFL